MSETQTTEKPERVYRVDKFVVPGEARDEFLDRVRRTHALLKTQPGLVHDMVLEQSGGPGEFNIVTVAEWESADCIAGAVAAVTALHREIGFNPREFTRERGIRADIAFYQRVSP